MAVVAAGVAPAAAPISRYAAVVAAPGVAAADVAGYGATAAIMAAAGEAAASVATAVVAGVVVAAVIAVAYFLVTCAVVSCAPCRRVVDTLVIVVVGHLYLVVSSTYYISLIILGPRM